jgi:putative phosphoesterase
MRYAVISDLHGNIDAVKRVWERLDDVDRIICLGDMIGIGPHPREVLEKVLDDDRFTWVMGNHEINTREGTELGPLEDIRRRPHHDWVRNDIGDMIKELKAPMSLGIDIKGRKVLLSHRHPKDCASKVPYFDMPFPEVLDDFYSDVDADMIFFGHTHVPLFVVGDYGRSYVNPGSVGAENGGQSQFAIIDDEAPSLISGMKVSYDVRSVVRDLKKKEMPGYDFIARHFYSGQGYGPR